MRGAIPAPGWGGDSTVTAKSLFDSADARSGIAQVTVRGNEDDPASAFVTIRFADGKRVDHALEIVDPTSFDGWRIWDIKE